MAEDLPIYPEPTLRTRLQFADLERLKHIDTAPLWEQSDVVMERFEGGANVRLAREKAIGPAKTDLLAMYSTVFGGGLRQKSMRPVTTQPLLSLLLVWFCGD